jgi:hypothetical protein
MLWDADLMMQVVNSGLVLFVVGFAAGAIVKMLWT